MNFALNSKATSLICVADFQSQSIYLVQHLRNLFRQNLLPRSTMAPKNRWLLALFVIFMSLVFYVLFIYTMALESGSWKNLEVSDFFGLIFFLPFTIGMFLCMCFAEETPDQCPIKADEKLGKAEEGAFDLGDPL